MFATNLEPLPTSLERRAANQAPRSVEDIKLRRRKWGELRWLATVSRPGICARLARIPLRGGDVYRINDVVNTVKMRQQATVLKYASLSHPWRRRMGASTEGCGAGEKRFTMELRPRRNGLTPRMATSRRRVNTDSAMWSALRLQLGANTAISCVGLRSSRGNRSRAADSLE